MRFIVLGAVTFAALSVAGPAVGAPIWSAPSELSSSGQQIELSTVAFDKTGRALAAWSELKAVQGRFRVQYVSDGWRTATHPPGATAFTAPRAAPSFVAGPVLYSTSRALGLDQHVTSQPNCGPRGQLRARFGTSSGSFDAPKTIATYTSTFRGGPAVAINDGGLGLAAWSDVQTNSTTCNPVGLRIAVRKPGGAFGTPGTLRGQGQPQDPSVAVGAGGDMLVAWQQRIGEGNDGSTIVEARYRPAGRSWSPVVVVGHGNTSSRPQTAVAANGRAYVAWGSAQINESIGQHGSFYVAVWPSGGKTFRAAQKLETVSGHVTGFLMAGPLLALTSTNALIAWTGYDSHWCVRVAQTDSSGRFATPQTVSDPSSDATLNDLSALTGGAAAVAWTTYSAGGEQPQAAATAYRAPGTAAFTAPEAVGNSTSGFPVATLALDPTTIEPTLLWPVRTTAKLTPTYLLAATRSLLP
jgi:hypothetical protein